MPMKILVTGAAGLVGNHLATRLAREHEVLALKHGDLDITDQQAVHRCLANTKPDVILNCAVLQVDDCEKDPAKAQAVNAEGPRYLAEAASEAGAEIVQFSTQYAFDGEPIGRQPYTIKDEPRPVNVYGATKVAGEQAALSTCPRTYIVRTSWVYGSGKNSFLCTVHNDFKSGRRVRVIDDIWSSTTYVEDLIDRVLLLLAKRSYGIYHVVNEGVCTYYEFALEAGRLIGLSPKQIDGLLEITHERDMKRVAARPRYTPLRCLLSEEMGLPPMRHWREALAEVCEGRNGVME
jgi:dTDP-4-dehydrorhamnose reductase